jgi:hypothetical protein
MFTHESIHPVTSPIQVLKLDGLDPLVMWGTGGRTGHVTMAVWRDAPGGKRGENKRADDGEAGGEEEVEATRELWVVESTDKSPLNSVYWPPPYGIIRTPWDQWVKQAAAAQFNAVLLPLNADMAGKFDEATFWAWFDTVQVRESASNVIVDLTSTIQCVAKYYTVKQFSCT